MSAIEIRTNENTAYFVATLINRILSENEIDRQIPSQMMYNYTRNGLIAKRTKNESAKLVRYSAEEVVLFVNKWFSKNYKLENVTTSSETNNEEVEGQIDLFEIEA
jgi:hypothetical protein